VLFNKIIGKNQMSQEWETGMVINIPKKGTKNKSKLLLFHYYKIHSNFKGNLAFPACGS
jgi:hypothetical protein